MHNKISFKMHIPYYNRLRSSVGSDSEDKDKVDSLYSTTRLLIKRPFDFALRISFNFIYPCPTMSFSLK